jgi:hypothetical protein
MTSLAPCRTCRLTACASHQPHLAQALSTAPEHISTLARTELQRFTLAHMAVHSRSSAFHDEQILHHHTQNTMRNGCRNVLGYSSVTFAASVVPTLARTTLVSSVRVHTYLNNEGGCGAPEQCLCARHRCLPQHSHVETVHMHCLHAWALASGKTMCTSSTWMQPPIRIEHKIVPQMLQQTLSAWLDTAVRCWGR